MPLDPLFAALEENLAEDLSVERLARAGHFSRSQLYREFYNATGHSVKEYVRKRRLSKALALIRHTDMPLTQIAHACGFGLPQALCKSVKAATGLTPAQYRDSGTEYYFPAYHGGRQAQVVTVSSETIPPVQCLRYTDSCPRGIEDRALAWLFAGRPGYRGRVFGRDSKQEGPKHCYELFIESDAPDQPAFSGMFAKTSCPNRESEITTAWDYLYNHWLKTSMLAHSGQPWFEEYIHTDGQIKRLQLYLPVSKRPGFHKIRLLRCDEMHFLVAAGTGPNAEKDAAAAVVAFLAGHHPRLAGEARQLYVSASARVTGIQLPAPMELPPGRGVGMLTQPAGEYAVLEGGHCGDAGAYRAVLAAWVDSMGLRAGAEPFAVHEMAGGVKIFQKI